MKAVLYTSNIHAAAVGVLVTMLNGKEEQCIVEVRKRAGSASYEYSFSGGVGNGITRLLANDIWKIAAENYGATLVPVDKKFMQGNFKGILKPYQELRKEERKIARELKAQKLMQKGEK